MHDNHHEAPEPTYMSKQFEPGQTSSMLGTTTAFLGASSFLSTSAQTKPTAATPSPMNYATTSTSAVSCPLTAI